MKLTELTPKTVDFTVCDVALNFRPFTIADDLKSQEICGGQKKLFEVFQNYNFEKISLIAWYQLTLESQQKVLEVVEGVMVDPETGEEIQVNLKPIDKFRNLFVGIPDQISLITDLLKCRGINIPDLDDEEALGKWLAGLAPALKLTGQ